MKYEIIQPPFTLNFRAMSRAEGNAYFKWFMGQMPIRIGILDEAVRSTTGYEGWQADGSPDSLVGLGQWFYDHVETRKRTEEEKEAIYSKGPKWFRSVEIEDCELTNRTFSLAMDIGMYLGRAVQINLPQTKWMMVKKPRNDMDYQQPVLKGTGRLVLNPVQILVLLHETDLDFVLKAD